MKSVFILCTLHLLFLMSCSINTKTKEITSAKKNSFSPVAIADSLDNINFYDFYGKTLEELFENDVVRSFQNYDAAVIIPRNFGYLQLGYNYNSEDYFKHRDLKILFPSLKYTNEDTLSRHTRISIEALLKERIRGIKSMHYPKVAKNKEEESYFLNNLKTIDFETYHRKPIDHVLKIPYLSKWTSILFSDSDMSYKKCLDDVSVFYNLTENRLVILTIYIDTFEHSEKCINPGEKAWNLNEIRKEKVKKIEIKYRGKGF